VSVTPQGGTQKGGGPSEALASGLAQLPLNKHTTESIVCNNLRPGLTDTE